MQLRGSFKVLLVSFLVSGIGAGSTPGSEGSVHVTVTTEQDTYERYEPIRLTLSVENRGDEVVTLHHPTAQRYDFLLEDEDGTVRWRWGDGRSFSREARTERLEPGERVEWRATFEGVLEPGTYVAQGLVLLADGRLEGRTEVQVR